MAGRPRSFDRDQALDTALHAFWADGFDRTSIAGLTDAIGINPPSLYAAFGDKEQLFGAAADRYVARFRSGLRACLERPTTHAAIAAVLAAAAAAHTDPATPAGCLVLSEPRLGDERLFLRERLAARIRRGQSAGDVPATADADALAGMFEAVMIGMSARARGGAGRAHLDAIAASAVQALPQDAPDPAISSSVR